MRGPHRLCSCDRDESSPLLTPGTEIDRETRDGEMSYLPERKKQVSLIEYLRKADPHRPIRSSIPASIKDAKRSAQRAANYIRNIGLAAALGLLLVLGGLVLS